MEICDKHNNKIGVRSQESDQDHEPLISVLVPVYNVEKYLNKCIESIINQTYKNLEIILVDDGSPDKCPQICDDWTKKDPRIKVIHKQNGGLYSARNTGLDNAHGKFIYFIDSDDYMKLDTIKILYDLIEKYDADISTGYFQCIDENGNNLDRVKINFTSEIEIFSRDEAFQRMKTDLRFIVTWAKLYKSYIFQNLRYPKCTIHEDEFLAHRRLGKANKIVATSQKLYMYLIRGNSLMSEVRRGFSVQHFNEIIEFNLDRYEYFTKLKNYDMAEWCINCICSGICSELSRVSYLKHRKLFNKSLIICVRLLMKSKSLKLKIKQPLRIFKHVMKNIIKDLLHKLN